MRAGLLSQPTVIAALKQHYVCTWTLPIWAQELSKNGTPTERAAAEALLADRELVGVVVLGPEGELIAHRDVADIFERFSFALGNREGDLRATQYFLSFLSESAKQALKPDVASSGAATQPEGPGAKSR